MGQVVEVNPPKPLSVREKKRLATLEGIINRNFQAFRDVVMAFKEIHDTRLYRVSYRRFEDYCRDKWDVTRQRAYQYIDAAKVVANLSTIVDILPANEAQIRPLVKLPHDQQIKTWQTALEAAPDGRITAAHVKKTVKGLAGEKVTKTFTQKRRDVEASTLISPEFSKAFDVFLAQIQIEIDNGWKTTDRNTVARHLRALLVAVEEDD